MELRLQTLDVSQGATVDIVIGMFVRRNVNRNIGFLVNDDEDFSRLLVGVSRPRIHLFLLIHIPTFSGDQYFKKIFNQIKEDNNDGSEVHAIKTITTYPYNRLYDYKDSDNY